MSNYPGNKVFETPEGQPSIQPSAPPMEEQINQIYNTNPIVIQEYRPHRQTMNEYVYPPMAPSNKRVHITRHNVYYVDDYDRRLREEKRERTFWQALCATFCCLFCCCPGPI
jgi:hypothetical protein